MAQQRDVVKDLSPPWLSSGTAERYLYNFGLAGDAILEKLNQGIRAAMPGVGTQTALVYIGNDMVIPRGPFEDADAYASRLQKAYEAWQRAGARRAILSQVLSYLSDPALVNNGQPVGAIVSGADPIIANWSLYYSGDDLSQPPFYIVPNPLGEFDWDGAAKWWRAWLVLYFTPRDLGRTGNAAFFNSNLGFGELQNLSAMTPADVGRFLVVTGAASAAHNGAFRIEEYVSSTHVRVGCGVSLGPDANDGTISWSVKEYPTVSPGPSWGSPGMVWGDPTRSWGLANPPGVMAGVREILREWQSAHSLYVDIVLVFSGGTGAAGEDFSPYSTSGAGNPDGTWEHFSKIDGSGNSVPARIFTGTSTPYQKFNCFAGGNPE
jgi:hypothetical protein